MILPKTLGSALFLLLSLVASSLFANIEITLQNDFIEKYKDQATISASFIVDKAHLHPNPAKKDGDLHAAGRAEEIGLPIVAEIMNASSQKAAVNAIHKAEGTGNPIPLTGVWRIWCEHGGDSQQIQGQSLLKPFKTTNPPHVFEIHPITKFNSTSIIGALHPIQGYKPKDAETAFLKYESLKSHIKVGAGTTSLVTTMAGYNYVEFVAVPLEEENPDAFSDGVGVLAAVHDLDGGFVLGVPRISLKLLSYRGAHHNENEEMLEWALPYELVIVGYYGKVDASKLE